MKFIDEYRDGDAAAQVRAGAAPHHHAAVDADGGLRRADARHRQVRRRRTAAAGGDAGARPGLPGVRDPAGADRQGDRDRLAAGRHLLLLRRHAARARPRRPTCCR